MPTARVHNDSTKEYVEKFRDDLIRIPGGKYVEMDKSDAQLFMGQPIAVKKDGLGNATTEKRLRIEFIATKEPEKMTPKCMLCKEEFQTVKELSLHTELEHKDAKRIDEIDTMKIKNR